MNRSQAAALALAGGIAALTAPAQAAGYLKIPDIPGESKAATAGDEHEVEYDLTAAASAGSAPAHEVAHVVQQRRGADGVPVPQADSDDPLDYLTITMANARANTGPVRWMAPEALARKPAAPRAAVPARGSAAARVAAPDPGPQESNFAILLDSGGGGGGSESGSGSELGQPPSRDSGQVAIDATWPGCRAGARYPHVLVGEDGGREYRLEGVQVAACSAEEVTLNYEKISW